MLDVLRRAGVELGPGLTDAELAAVRTRYGIVLAPAHRAFLRAALPSGPGWVDWRSAEMADRLAAPVDGVLFDVEHNGFWPPAWGVRADDVAVRQDTARRQLVDVPQLIPVYRHRFLAAGVDGPVLSVHQTDVIHYGVDLADYLEREFGGDRRPVGRPARRVPFWSDLTDPDNGAGLTTAPV